MPALSDPEHFFLIVSNMRCGSTLTQFMLGELSDVSTDFEVKWKPTYTPHPIHLVIDEQTGSMKNRLKETIKPNRIIGSKLVFDPVPHSPEEYQNILRMIEPDIRIIHIKRPYWEIAMSSLRGFIHMPTQASDASSSSAYQLLLDRKENASEKAQCIIKEREINKPALYQQMKILFENDLCALRLMRKHPYLLTSYRRLKKDLGQLSQHIGSHENAERIRAIATKPPLEKLPPIRHEGNFFGLKCLCLLFDMAFYLAVVTRS